MSGAIKSLAELLHTQLEPVVPGAQQSLRALSSFYQRHRFVVSAAYDTPWMKNQEGILERFVGGWTMSGVMTFAFLSGDAYIPLLLQTWRGTPATLTGIVFTATTLSWTASSWLPARSNVWLISWRQPLRRTATP